MFTKIIEMCMYGDGFAWKRFIRGEWNAWAINKHKSKR